MKFPNKVNRYKTTVIYAMVVLLDGMDDSCSDISRLYKKVAKKIGIQEFVDAITCLYAIGMVKDDENGGITKCSKK